MADISVGGASTDGASGADTSAVRTPEVETPSGEISLFCGGLGIMLIGLHLEASIAAEITVQ